MWTREGGGGGSRKNHVCPHRGEGGLEACPRGQKLFSATSFLGMNSKKVCENFKKKIVFVNELLVYPFEQLYYDFLGKKWC